MWLALLQEAKLGFAMAALVSGERICLMFGKGEGG